MVEVVTAPAVQHDVATLRRALSQRHSKLRAEGKNPLEALETLADQLSSGIFNDWAVAPLAAESATVAWTAFQEFITTDLRGAFGQYLTPPVVAGHAAELLCQTTRTGVVMDPFLGSGVLLDAVARCGTYQLVGVEINRPVAHVADAAMSFAGHSASIVLGDAFAQWSHGLLPRVDAVITNPPFGAHLGTVELKSLPSDRVPSSLTGMGRVPVELLAMALSMDRLRSGGTLVIVLPQSVLTNNRFCDFRRELFSSHTLKHVSSLPEETFAPFRGVAKACVLLIEKTPPKKPPYAIGYDYIRDVGYDATGRPTGREDVCQVSARYRAGTQPPGLVTVEGAVCAEPSEMIGGKEHRLGDLAEIFRGKNPNRDSYVEQGPFLLKVGDLAGGFISWRERTRTFVPHAFFAANHAKHLRVGDVCFTGSAHTPRYIAQKVDLITTVPESGAMASGEVIVLRLRDGAPISPIGLLYYIRSSRGRGAIQQLVRGSTAHVYPKDLMELRIPEDYLGERDAVVAALHAEAEASFRRYLEIEDQIATLVQL